MVAYELLWSTTQNKRACCCGRTRRTFLSYLGEAQVWLPSLQTLQKAKNAPNKLNVRFKAIYTASSQQVYFKITMELIKYEYVLLK